MNKTVQEFIAECIQEVMSESMGGDPSKAEMIDYLKGIYKGEADEFSMEEAIYWFGHHNHGGQNSNLYSALSTSKYRPGPIARGPERESMAEMMYQALEDKWGTPQPKEYPEETDSLPTARQRIEPVWEADYVIPPKSGDNKSAVAYDYGWGWGKFNREVGGQSQTPTMGAGNSEYGRAFTAGFSDGLNGVYQNQFKPSRPPSRIDEAKGPITVTYSVAGLEQIPDSQHATKEEALKAAKEFIQSYATPKAKAAGEVMMRTQDGYALKHIGGGTVAFATMNISRRMPEASSPEPYDAESDSFQPSPRERTDEVPPKEWMYDPKYIGDTIEKTYGRQPSLQDIMEYFSHEYGQQAHSKLVRKVIERFSERNPNFYIVLPRNQSSESLTEGMMETVGVPRPDRIEKKEIRAISNALGKQGLDGNIRFEKKEQGLSIIHRVLEQFGFQLDMVSADIIMGDRNTRLLPFRRVNDPGADPFTEKPMIENSRIQFTWENLAGEGQTPRFEILAFPTS